jgi:hypothetical protein
MIIYHKLLFLNYYIYDMLNVLGALDSLIGASSIPLPSPTPADSTNSAYVIFQTYLIVFPKSQKTIQIYQKT